MGIGDLRQVDAELALFSLAPAVARRLLDPVGRRPQAQAGYALVVLVAPVEPEEGRVHVDAAGLVGASAKRLPIGADEWPVYALQRPASPAQGARPIDIGPGAGPALSRGLRLLSLKTVSQTRRLTADPQKNYYIAENL